MSARLARVPLLVWAFLLVPLAIELFWVFWPAANSFSLALTRWDGIGLAEPVGLQNFRDLAADPIFLTALRNNVIWVLGFGGLSVVGGLALAVTLNKPGPMVSLYRSAIYLPMVVSLAVSGLFWRVMYAPDGPINGTLGLLGLEHLERQWLADPAVALWAVLIAAVWRQVGYIMVLYLAGLKGTDGTLEEAAAVDGANAWQRFWRIVMPQLRGVNMVVFAVTVIDSLRTFDIVWAMTRGGPYNETQLLSTYMFQQAFTTGNLGYASAIAVVIFALAIGFIITYLARQARTED
ncbi:carbohydrate ABC transporter permease [Promicromonospora sp. NPDC052451]|uniref:carbohydrate ABC transporter permease n=1 Tax=unclassified Promicromonospora TaxID=2647929 RepID=UPI0037CC07D5